jgi:hypothetical protein
MTQRILWSIMKYIFEKYGVKILTEMKWFRMRANGEIL